MVPDEEMTCYRRWWPWWRWCLTGLSALALVLSGYLGWHVLTGGSVIGCSGGSPCDQVLSSRWSTIGGVVPVSALAAGVYMAMLAASLFIGPATATPVRRLAWGAMLVLMGSAAGSAIWFIIVQKWIIGAFCPYCMSAHTIGLALAALVIWRAPRQFDDRSMGIALTNSAPVQGVSPAIGRRIIGLVPAIGLAIVGLALAGIMAVCQVVITPPAVYRSGQSQGNVTGVDPHTMPLIGSPDASYVVTLLFDYKCSHCQQLHFLLDEVIRRYDGKLAIALCPTPLDRQCNPYIPRDVEEFKDSCELARVGLAVWRARREVFADFNRWMFTLESGDRWRPRSLDAARSKAVELAGQAQFDAALADPWVEQYMQNSIGMYGQTGGNAIPKLVYGSRWVIPQVYDADNLISILQNSLAVPGP